MRALFRSTPPTCAWPTWPRLRQGIEQTGLDEGRVHAVQDLEEAIHHLPQRADDGRIEFEPGPAAQVADIVGHSLDAEHALAFGIDLQGCPVVVHPEDDAIIRRSLEHDLHLWLLRLRVALAPALALSAPE
jgi:hypothetical protein